MDESLEVDYQRVTALLLARDALAQPEHAGKTVLDRAKWLMALGFTRADAAQILGSTSESLRVMLAQEARKARGS